MKSMGRILVAALLLASLALPLSLMGVMAQDTVFEPIVKFVGTIDGLPAGEDHIGTWTVEGREVEVVASTLISDDAGPVEVGAEVIVVAKEREDGSLQALLIRVLGDTPEGGEIHLQGRISEVGESYFVLNGLHINYDESTNVDGEIEAGVWASVIAVKTADGYLATDVKTYAMNLDDIVEVEGQVEGIVGDIWTVDGREIVVTDETVLFGDPGEGDQVEVRAHVEDDGTLTALLIRKVFSQVAEKVEFTGVIESLPDYRFGEWVVGGRTVFVTPLTRIQGTPDVGDTATVTAWQLGERLVAIQIVIEGEADEATFVGVIQFISGGGRGLWVIGGKAVFVTEETEIVGTPEIGAEAMVTGHAGRYGFFIATLIEITGEPEPTETIPPEPGERLHVTGLITEVGPDYIVVNNHIKAYIDSETTIEGPLQVGRWAGVIARIAPDRYIAISIVTWAPGENNTAARPVSGARLNLFQR